MTVRSILIGAVTLLVVSALSGEFHRAEPQKGSAARVRSGGQAPASGRVQVSGRARLGTGRYAVRLGGYYGHAGLYGYYGPFWYGWGYPYHYAGYHAHGGPYYRAPYARAGAEWEPVGALDLNVRPRTTEVYIDGEYVGLARNFDGYPGYLWLDEGAYELALYKPGYRTVTRELRVHADALIEVRERLEEGESVRPEPPARPAAEQPTGETETAPSAPRGSRTGEGKVMTFPRRDEQR